MKAVAILAVAALLASPAPAREQGVDSSPPTVRLLPARHGGAERFESTRDIWSDTLWIFDADFEDLAGDNAGWMSFDVSGTLAIPNHWHKDTIRINGFTHLGDSTWWCGMYEPCQWRQPRGYGNDWSDILVRDFPEVAVFTDPGDVLVLEYDQRIAMERDYDYGYTEVSVDGGATWTTVYVVDNPGFAGTPGTSQDWDSTNPATPGHMEIDLGDFAGEYLSLRFRFDSDCAYSSQDQYNNPPWNSCLDGAWQLDNFELWTMDPDTVVIFFDDCESPGDNGWNHDDVPAQGQTGVTFWRGLYGTDIWTNRPFTCDEESGWMYAAVDPATSRMVDNEDAWLVSPAIDVAGAERIVGQWTMWVDLPRPTEDVFALSIACYDDPECWEFSTGGMEPPGAWYGGPFWGTWGDDWDAYAGNPWLRFRWELWNSDPTPVGVEHMGGIFLDRHRVGIPTGERLSEWSYEAWYRFNDWFEEQLAEAMLDSAVVNVKDDHDVVSVSLIAKNGTTTNSYPCMRIDPEANDWVAPPPAGEMLPGSEIHYYFEAVDGLGNVSTYPRGAPGDYFEFSILPINGNVSEPCVLLVDKHGRLTPGDRRDYSHYSQDYYEEALEILGFEYDRYDVEVPGGSVQSDGPDTAGMKYYDTQIWLTSETDDHVVTPTDQSNLAFWLGQSSEGKERNLLIAGNDVSASLGDSTGFAADWLCVDYREPSVGGAASDTVPRLREVAGGHDFLTHADGECVLSGGCPLLAGFDVVEPHAVIPTTDLVAHYVLEDSSTRPAGVAYTAEAGHQAVTLGFGLEFMEDDGAVTPGRGRGNGIHDRVDLMGNIMEYFGKAPTGPATGTEEHRVFVTRLEPARPNPFNPSTTLAFSLSSDGRTALRVYDAAGRLVATLVDSEFEAGPHEVVWDGKSDSGESAASGVYFVKLEAAGVEDRGKLVLLK